MKSNPFSRNAIVGYLLSLIAILVIAQMVRIQTSAGGKALTDEGNNYYTIIHETIYPERGNIFDRWGHLLAGNREVFDVGLDLISITDKATIAKDVAAVLGMDYGDVLKAVNVPYVRGKTEYYPLATSIDPGKIQQLEKLKKQYYDQMVSHKWAKGEIPPNLDGVIWVPRLQRTYPEKTIASNVIGFVGFKDPKGGNAYFGIEQQYNNLLAGNPIQADIPVNPNMIQQMPKIPPGVSLVLTIDRQIQVTVEKILDKAVASSGSKSGTIIISDPKTGEILAIATTPRMDLNE
jgi:cell division protein FtsI/penicillin-binding protein 2